MKPSKTVEEYILTTQDWQQLKLNLLRDLALQCGLTETIKWGGPVYMHKSNVLGIGAFKNWVALWFFQGVYLADEQKKLVAAGDATKGLRQWRFMPNEDVNEALVKAYMMEAIANDEAELKIKPAAVDREIVIPEILAEALSEKRELPGLFDSLSRSHKREYAGYVAEAKQDGTKQRRVQKVLDMLLKNVELHDKYKSK